jgi:hypothetical protein
VFSRAVNFLFVTIASVCEPCSRYVEFDFVLLTIDVRFGTVGRQAEDLRKQAESLEVAMGQASHDSMQSFRRFSIGGFKVNCNDQQNCFGEATSDNMNNVDKNMFLGEFKALKNVGVLRDDSEQNH